MRSWIVMVLWLAVVTCPGLSLAETPAEANPPGQEAPGEEEVWLDKAHRKVSGTLRETSQWVDGFFDNNRFIEEENRTRARLKLGLRYTEGEDLEFEPRINLRVHLHRLSQSAYLLLFATEEEKPEIGVLRTDPTFEDDSNKEAGAALQYFLKETEKYNISFTGGGSTGYLYGGVRYRYLKELGDWQARLMAQLRYYTDDGLKNLDTLDFDRKYSETWFFRTTFQLEWLEEEDDNDLPFALAFRLYQTLDEDRVLSYEWENRMEEVGEGEISEVMLLFRYRQRFLREWLFYEVSPRVTFPEEEDWDPELAVLFKVDMNIGFLQ